MVREGLKQRLDIWSPVRQYPREMLTATLLYFFYLFTWIGWSAWMPQFLANEKHLGFQTTASYLSIWMFCAIFAYYLCGWLSDLFGRRYVIPGFILPASILLVVLGYLDTPSSLFWVGLVLNFLITGSFGAGLGYNTECFQPRSAGRLLARRLPLAAQQPRPHRQSSAGLQRPIQSRRRFHSSRSRSSCSCRCSCS